MRTTTYLRVRCYSCGRYWHVYERDYNSDYARVCPICGAEVDAQTWTKQVIPALAQTADANRELQKDHSGQHTPLFSVAICTQNAN